MSYKDLKQICNEVIEQIQSSSYYADLYEKSLKHIRDIVLEINQKNLENSNYNEDDILNSESANVIEDCNITDRNNGSNLTEFDFHDIIPPQIKLRSTPQPVRMPPTVVQPSIPTGIQTSITPIFNQPVLASGMGENVDSLIAQASQVPFLYHNQQL